MGYLPVPVLEHHGLHVVGHRYLGHPSQVVKGMHHAGEQSLEILSLRELHVAHSRVTECQHKQIQAMVEKVAEVRPVELALLAGCRLEAHEGSFPFFDSPVREQVTNPCVAP